MNRNKDILIIDYGLGNLFSLQRAIRHIGFDCEISGEAERLSRASHLFLPGVGAFGDGMSGLGVRGLVPVLKDLVAAGKPLLGICLGMQLLLSESEEFGLHRGLDLIRGRVIRFKDPEGEFPEHKVPHVGWSALKPQKTPGWDHGLLKGTSPGESAYFVHSYYAVPEEPAAVWALTAYAGVDFCSVIQKKNVYGTQFHPEKSGPAGLRMLKNFLEDV